MINTKDQEEESVLKEDKGTEESPLIHMEQTTASPVVSHTELNFVYDNITGEHSDHQGSHFKLLIFITRSQSVN